MGHAASQLLADLAERSGLDQGLSKYAPRKRHDPSALQVAAAATAQASEPQEGANGSCDYKMVIVTTLVRRSLERTLSHTAHDVPGNGQVKSF